MRLKITRIVTAAGLLALGWTAGHAAQAPQADFDIEITSPAGTTTVTCTARLWIAVHPNDARQVEG